MRLILALLLLGASALAVRDGFRAALSWDVVRAARASVSNPAYPNVLLTPGEIVANTTTFEVCVPGYTRHVRYVPMDVKRRVYAEYGVAYTRGAREVDHLIPLELGGSNSIRNLWPEPYSGTWNARVKDRIESRLYDLVCNGAIPLATAQHAIATDWIAAYRKYLGPVPSEARYYPHRRTGHWGRAW